jgi:hypothetical protein
LANWKIEIIKELDINKDIAVIENIQLYTMGVYGELNERLYLSYRFGKYIDPIKDLIIGKTIPIEYKPFFQICIGKITEEEWLKLPIETSLAARF